MQKNETLAKFFAKDFFPQSLIFDRAILNSIRGNSLPMVVCGWQKEKSYFSDIAMS